MSSKARAGAVLHFRLLVSAPGGKKAFKAEENWTSRSATASSSVGQYSITPTLHDPDGKLSNYTLTSNNGTLTVTPAALLVSADNKSKYYYSPNPQLTGSVLGVVNNDGITATFSTTAILTSAVGTYPITSTLLDLSSKLNNYTVTQNNGTLNVLADPAPDTTITGPADIVALDIFSVTGTFTDAGTANGVYTVEWNFGDGSAVVTGTLTPTHEFEHFGSYNVTLTVRDDHGGVGIDTLNVTVMSAYGCASEAQDKLKPFVKESKRIDRAVRDIGASLEPKLWIDEMHVNAKDGQKVFIKLRQAMEMLDDLIADPKDKKSRDSDFDREDDDEFKKIKGDPKKETVSAAAKSAMREALADLICAARLISETLYLENKDLKAANPKH